MKAKKTKPDKSIYYQKTLFNPKIQIPNLNECDL